jgi:hypothetical protein
LFVLFPLRFASRVACSFVVFLFFVVHSEVDEETDH